ncbi:MAG: hypothetical protein GY799_30460 [Desulfobulbaceae bacterium]|nr:hypothetical protein [Desulfobulbaceae bacterium]
MALFGGVICNPEDFLTSTLTGQSAQVMIPDSDLLWLADKPFPKQGVYMKTNLTKQVRREGDALPDPQKMRLECPTTVYEFKKKEVDWRYSQPRVSQQYGDTEEKTARLFRFLNKDINAGTISDLPWHIYRSGEGEPALVISSGLRLPQIGGVIEDYLIKRWNNVYRPTQAGVLLPEKFRQEFAVTGSLSAAAKDFIHKHQHNIPVLTPDPPLRSSALSDKSVGLRGLASYQSMDNFYTRFSNSNVLMEMQI